MVARDTGISAPSSGIFSMIFKRGVELHGLRVGTWARESELESLSSHLAGFVDGRRRCAGNASRGWWTGAERR